MLPVIFLQYKLILGSCGAETRGTTAGFRELRKNDKVWEKKEFISTELRGLQVISIYM
jgi:hypothetical protein